MFFSKYNILYKNSIDYNFPIHKPYYELSDDQKKLLWDGDKNIIGINKFFQKLEAKLYKIQNRVLLSRYRGKTTCNACNGNRLNKEAGYVKINNKNIFDLINMPIEDLEQFFKTININNRITNEIKDRLECLNKLGLGYLTLNRKSSTIFFSYRRYLPSAIGTLTNLRRLGVHIYIYIYIYILKKIPVVFSFQFYLEKCKKIISIFLFSVFVSSPAVSY